MLISPIVGQVTKGVAPSDPKLSNRSTPLEVGSINTFSAEFSARLHAKMTKKSLKKIENPNLPAPTQN